MKLSKIRTLAIFIIGIFLLSSNTYAQAMPLLSDPIKVRELERTSELLDLTLLQQKAAIEVYDRYLEDFSRVRRGAIKAFEDSIADASETFGFMNFTIPEREMVEDLIRKAQRAIKAIHQSDSLFYEEIFGMLTQKQKIVLGRIQISRELEAYEMFIQFLIGQLNEGAQTRMRKLYNALEIDSNEELDATMEIYDQRYLKEVKHGFDAVVETIKLALDIIDELGIRDQDQQALMMRYMMDETAIEDLKRRGDLLLKPLVNQAYAISQLNWKTWNKLDSLLDEDNARKLQEWYFGKSFRDAVSGGTKVDSYLKAAISLNTISEGQRIDLEELQNSFNTKWSSLTEKYAKILEQSRQVLTIAIMSGDVPSGFEERLATLHTGRQEYIDKTTSRIESILGKELFAQLGENEDMHGYAEEKFYPGDDGVFVMSSTGEGMTEEEIEELHGMTGVAQFGSTDGKELTAEEIAELKNSGKIHVVELQNENGEWVEAKGQSVEIRTFDSSDSVGSVEETLKLEGGTTIPQPIAPTFSKRAATILNLDENGEIIISAVYDEYREQYAIADKAISSKSKMISDDTDLSKALRKRKSNELGEAAAAAVADLDRVFFDDLATITNLERDDANLKMLEDHRDRQRESAPDDPFGWGGGVDTIDLVGLYVMSDLSDELHEGLSDETISAIRNSMQKYHDNVAVQHYAFVEAKLAANHMQDVMWLMDDSQSDGNVAETMQRRWADTFTAVRNTKRSLMLANQEVMDTLLKAIPESDFWKVRMEFVKKAYPDVFTKSTDVTMMLAAAVAIQSLSLEQEKQMETLASWYRNEYWNLCEAMIENHKSNASATSGEKMVTKEDMYRQLKLETLRFDRNELNDRVRMRLRMTLNEDQIKNVPGLRPTVTARVGN